MPKLIANRRMRHNGKLLHRGDMFVASDKEARLYVAVKVAALDYADEPATSPAPTVGEPPRRRRGRPRKSESVPKRELLPEPTSNIDPPAQGHEPEVPAAFVPAITRLGPREP